ncbi:serine/threonine-protein kinase RIO3-like [Mizuhopecten yessoensis]|uniref:Serine/threonine-protein kinase RIO3 n=1 Tax=Mizuhopecten yessoensis TaxID=6573 RepID=A0A210QKA5_MIZYE|nr:serine/threonine-protein kinase RIO3-like [Mizuhopecten yessoensis]XP_021356160.1 serine/threonine-protein kinase RIO3-like [Mizuhopecten yessoensis]XP_021356161.1 serine/threonine-protein kinase RIO3-like [Mizuhopecten yessoensis]XP_021356162.1 serine/threonine-protein kinase RIO3-like [Mizuhopecten yessoensis]OWF49187.1 Serine/threonine-protein kinase RIO3 [Mizuhopecten yessoensis]
MSSPWGKVTSAPVAPCSLEEVMSEQLAADLQAKADLTEWEFISGAEVDPEINLVTLTAGMSSEETKNDQMLAQILQMEFDKEYDKEVKAKEKKYNGESKVSLSFENYRTLHPAYRDDEDEIVPQLDDDYEVEMKWDKKTPTFNHQGVSGKGKDMITKHDSSVCGRRNASRMMEFPPEFEVGDGEGMDMKLPNHVYNKLKLHSIAENKRSQRLHEKKEFSTAEQAMDPRTRLMLYKMVNSLVLDSISGSISTGKESVVFHAFGGEIAGEAMPKEVAIKVFKTTLNEFKNREKYIHGDHRFSKDDFKKQNPRKIIKMWAMKETANLNRMKKFGLPCPVVQVQKMHVLVMSFIGEDQKPAPKLKDALMSGADLEDAYNQTLEFMKTMQHKCNLVHADLSEYNMLWWKDKVWVIDVSQAVDTTHPLAMEFLHRDCTNVSKFFHSGGVHKVMSPEEMFNHVTGLDISGEGADFISQVRRYDTEKSEEYLLCPTTDRKHFAFDFFFDKSQQERQEALKEVGFSDSEEEDIEKEEN